MIPFNEKSMGPRGTQMPDLCWPARASAAAKPAGHEEATPPVSLFDGYLTDPTRPHESHELGPARWVGSVPHVHVLGVGLWRPRSAAPLKKSYFLRAAGEFFSGVRGGNAVFFDFWGVTS